MENELRDALKRMGQKMEDRHMAMPAVLGAPYNLEPQTEQPADPYAAFAGGLWTYAEKMKSPK